MSDILPPRNETELINRAASLAGLSLQQLADKLLSPLPDNPRKAKGWMGQAIEKVLGATAASLAEPDFQLIGVELKTLPLTPSGKPKESTYVCTVPLDNLQNIQWENCWLKRKLQRVLWVPFEADPRIAIAHRHIGNPVLWSPSAEEERQLKMDWEELMDLVCLGELDKISSHMGEVLQIRPKAANAQSLKPAFDNSGQAIKTLPRGFYLRPGFTQHIIEQYYV